MNSITRIKHNRIPSNAKNAVRNDRSEDRKNESGMRFLVSRVYKFKIILYKRNNAKEYTKTQESMK
jgi:hypothetical protein